MPVHGRLFVSPRLVGQVDSPESGSPGQMGPPDQPGFFERTHHLQSLRHRVRQWARQGKGQNDGAPDKLAHLPSEEVRQEGEDQPPPAPRVVDRHLRERWQNAAGGVGEPRQLTNNKAENSECRGSRHGSKAAAGPQRARHKAAISLAGPVVCAFPPGRLPKRAPHCCRRFRYYHGSRGQPTTTWVVPKSRNDRMDSRNEWRGRHVVLNARRFAVIDIASRNSRRYRRCALVHPPA